MNQRVSKNNSIFSDLAYYIVVWFAILRKSASKSMTYRVDFLSKFIRIAMLLIIQLIVINSIFVGTDYIEGWSIEEYYLLTGTFNLINYVSWGLFNVNLWRIEEKVLKGEFDFVLLKPTGSIFAASFSEFFIDDALSAISGLLLIGYYFVVNFGTITITGLIGYILTIIFGFIVWFSIHLAVASVNFISVKNGLMSLTKSVTRTASFPVDIFPSSIRAILYTFLPLAFIAVVPTRILSGVFSWVFVLFAFVVCVISILVSQAIWKKNLSKYTSAGG